MLVSDFLLMTCRCGAKYSNRAGAAQAHKGVFGHWPMETPTAPGGGDSHARTIALEGPPPGEEASC